MESLPGMGKSTTIDLVIQKCAIEAIAIGAYATPLHIYNKMCRHPNSILILDDCASLFSDQKAMAILKAATWGSSGHGGSADARKLRRVSWGSTSDKVEKSTTDFFGKIVLLTNSIPTGKETEAFLSRCLSYRIRMSEEDIRRIIFDAANSQFFFPNSEVANQVAHFLFHEAKGIDTMKVSFRTLKMGYDFAVTNPDSWKELFLHVLPSLIQRSYTSPPTKTDVSENVQELLNSKLSIKEQESEFLKTTGKSRRTFYVYRRRMGLSRSYQTEKLGRRDLGGFESTS